MVKQMKIYVVGGGMGREDLLTDYAKGIIHSSDIVLTTDRLFENLAVSHPNKKKMKISEMDAFLLSACKTDQTVCIIASGDVGFFSIAKSIQEKWSNMCEVEFVSGISSLQYFTSKLQRSYDDIKIISLHGRNKSVVPYVCYNKTVFCLTGSNKSADQIIRELVESGLEDVFVSIGENLSSDRERIVSAAAKELLGVEFDSLSVMLIDNENYTNSNLVLRDDNFIRAKTPMTKQCVRTVSLDMLCPMPQDVVYDVGAGTGSVSVCLAMRVSESVVYAIEKDTAALDLIRQNRKKHGTYNIKVAEGSAPEILKELPAPDKVFIGGSKGNLKEIVLLCMEKNPNVVLVVNAVTLETLAQAVETFKELEMGYEVVCLNVAKADQLGSYNLMKSENPVYIIRGEKQ